MGEYESIGGLAPLSLWRSAEPRSTRERRREHLGHELVDAFWSGEGFKGRARELNRSDSVA